MITRSNLSPAVTERATERWNKLISEDIARVNAKWKKKIAGVRESYIKDQEYVMNNSRIRTSNSRSHQQQDHQLQHQQEQHQRLQFYSKQINSNRTVTPFNQGFPTVNNSRFSAPMVPTFLAATTTAATLPVVQTAAQFSSAPLRQPPPGIAEPGILPVHPSTSNENSASNMSAPPSTAFGNTESPPITVLSNNNNLTNTASGGARPRTDDAPKNGRGQSSYNLRS